jgi:hypothetical protein
MDLEIVCCRYNGLNVCALKGRCCVHTSSFGIKGAESESALQETSVPAPAQASQRALHVSMSGRQQNFAAVVPLEVQGLRQLRLGLDNLLQQVRCVLLIHSLSLLDAVCRN